MDVKKQLQWHAMTAQEVLKHFSVTADKGLDQHAVEERKRIFGPNSIEQVHVWKWWQTFVHQILNPLVIILLVAAALTFFILKDFNDAVIILLAVAINTVIGVIQERRADRAFEALAKTIRKRTRVMREGHVSEIDAVNLVPGDIMVLEAGMSIDADARLIRARRLGTNESMLTGEWNIQEKNSDVIEAQAPLADRANMVFAGTLCQSGEGLAVVVAVGAASQLGALASSLDTIEKPETPLQKTLARFSRFVGGIVFFVSVILFAAGIWRGESVQKMFLTTVALAVSAVPEGLPVAVTVILALGAERILKKGGLIKKLKSAEILGSVNIILTDKTGTLTEGRMEVSHVVPHSGKDDDKEKVLRVAVLTSNAIIENPDDDLAEWRIHGDPVDQALVKAGMSLGITKEHFHGFYELLDYYPFDSETRFSGVAYRQIKADNFAFFATGAPEVLLNMCAMTEAERTHLEALYRDIVGHGARVIACAERHEKKMPLASKEYFTHMRFVGFIGFHDPLRSDAKDALQYAVRAGIRPVIVTGDHKLTAMRVAEQLHFDGQESHVAEGIDFENNHVDIEKIDIFARVLPHQKALIAGAWQQKGMVVAMTGDGVNDAPALKHADIGIALGSGTDVAKETADLVLIDDSFSTIVSAIEEGRTIVDNLRKVITFLCATSFTAVVLVGGAFVLGLPLPILPAQILWMNIVGEGFFNFAFAFEKKEEDVLLEPATNPFFTREMVALIFAGGLVSDIILFIVFERALASGLALDVAQSLMFIGLALNSFFFVFSLRSLRRPLWRINFFSNPYLLFAVLASMGLLVPAFFVPEMRNLLNIVPLNSSQVGIMIALGFVDLLLVEMIKLFFITRSRTSR